MNNERCWAEINLKQLRKNLTVYRSSVSEKMEIMAVVKADAYGHGDIAVSKCLYENGIHNFAVSNIDEAIRIRCSGIKGQILILGYTPINRAQDLVDYNIIQTLLSEEYAEHIASLKLPIRCQFALDTGMRRIGLNADNIDECERIIRKYASMLCGVFTHLCVADTPAQKDFTLGQISKFENVVKRISDLHLPYCHCMNSAGGIWYHSDDSCFARLGIILYGLKPDCLNELPDGIKPVMSWKSVVSMLKMIKPGDSIGYGRSFVAKTEMKIATVPTGYADGYPRLLSNNGWVLINGYRAPIVGRICMDQMMVDVTHIPDVDFESEVILIGESGNYTITADDLANNIGTIGYEILCGISKRVKRLYLD